MGFRAIAVLITLFAATAAAADVGVFTDVNGEVKLLRGDYYFEAAPGVEVQDQDIIETGSEASTQVEMTDGSVLRLGADSRLALSEYRLDSGGNVIAASLDVLSGWLRFAVAKLHDNAAYHIETPTMTIGIRGTEGVIEAKNTQGGLYLEEGAVELKAPDTPNHATQLKAGEYVERVHGRPFQRFRESPATFRNRMPPLFAQRLQRRAHLLRQRGLAPRQIRRLSREDIQRYLQQHPHRRQLLERRFKVLRNQSELREKAQQRNQERREERQRKRRERTREE